MIEENFDVPFIADLALREKQIQQNYRPIIAVHKWFARRPGTLFRGLLLSEFSELPLRDIFYEANTFSGVHVADPFMGGGTPILEANRVGCDVTGFDINPMAYWIVKQEIEHLDLDDYQNAADSLRRSLGKEIGHCYRTRCEQCGTDAHVKYFLWVKTIQCRDCGGDISLFPGFVVAAAGRHPKNVFVCPKCGELVETDDRKHPGACPHCGETLALEGPARRGKCTCPACACPQSYPISDSGPPKHRLFAIEYHCHACKPGHSGRFFKKPDAKDLDNVDDAVNRWKKMRARFVPDDRIPSGDETNRLHRWGYSRYREMFNERQLLGLELSARLIAKIRDDRVRNALATNLSDLLRYQNMLCRYDTRSLKSLDIFSVHGFPVGLIQCESNLLGIVDERRPVCVGSGGWANITEKFRKAKSYCESPFEVRHEGRKKITVSISGEWIGDSCGSKESGSERIVNLSCRDAASCEWPDDSLDAVFTDPPYFGNVQYAELMDFCYVWLKRLVAGSSEAFQADSTRNLNELTGNVDMGRDLNHFTEGLSNVFRRMARGLKRKSPLAFTYHHNEIDAYFPVAVAILDSGLTCSASLPCPAEMGASIHINGTGSSIVDTVFVCRKSGFIKRKLLAKSPEEVARIVVADLNQLKAGNVKPTLGDTRCIVFGHLIRLAIWALRADWKACGPTAGRIGKVAAWIHHFGGPDEIERFIGGNSLDPTENLPLFSVKECPSEYGDQNDEVPF